MESARGRQPVCGAPSRSIRLSSSPSRRPRAPRHIAGPDHAAILIAALPLSERALWPTALYAGLRLGELQALETFTVNNATTNFGDNVYLTGNDAELCNWCTTTSGTVGRFVDPSYPTWFDVASLPARTTVQYKCIIIHTDGTVTWEGGSNHQYTTPSSGNTGSVTDNW